MGASRAFTAGGDFHPAPKEVPKHLALAYHPPGAQAPREAPAEGFRGNPKGSAGGQGGQELLVVLGAGEPGEERTLRVELRTVADVGLVGLPNAGKSTLLAALTRARPKIAPYPFTTLSPNLGVREGDRRVVLADIPGLIEGASEGRGLGHRFLRHIVRCRALVLVVDGSSPDPAADLAAVRAELRAYDPELPARAAVVAWTKADLVPDATPPSAGLRVSGVTGEGIEDLARALEEAVIAAERDAEEREPIVVLRPGRPTFVVRREGEAFRVVGRGVERWVAETDFDDEGEVAALQRRLAKEGVERQLAAAGAVRGDEVRIGDRAFDFLPEDGAGRP